MIGVLAASLDSFLQIPPIFTITYLGRSSQVNVYITLSSLLSSSFVMMAQSNVRSYKITLHFRDQNHSQCEPFAI